MPEEPEVPFTPLVPEEPEVPFTPLVPEEPEVPDEPEVPLVPTQTPLLKIVALPEIITMLGELPKLSAQNVKEPLVTGPTLTKVPEQSL